MEKIVYLLVYLIYFTTPFESIAIAPNFSIVKLITILFILSAVIYFKNVPSTKNGFLKLFAIYTLYGLLSTIWSIDKETTFLFSIGTTIPTFILIIYLYHSIKNKTHIDNVFKAYALGSSIAAIVALHALIYGNIFTSQNAEGRLTVFGQDQNELSFLFSFGIVSFIYLLNYSPLNKLEKLLSLLCSLILTYAILITGSRTGFIILISIGLVLILMNLKSIKILLILPLLLIIGIKMFQFLPESLTQRLLQTSEQISERDFTGRGYIWQRGWNAFMQTDAQIQGTGLKTFRTLLAQTYDGWSKAPHNTYLSTFIELGIIGFTIFLGMIINLTKKVYFLAKKESIFFILLLLPLLIAMITLGLEGRRWLYLIGILIIKLSQLIQINEFNHIKHV